MDDFTVTLSNQENVRLRWHPLARAVALSLMGAALFGCAGNAPRGSEAVESARSAYAREDYEKAAQLLAVPAMQGDAEAQYALGYLYYYGKGVRKDQRRARAWFEDSARLGHAGAKKALTMLSVYAQLPPLPGEQAARPATAAYGVDENPSPREAGAHAPDDAALWPAEISRAAETPRAGDASSASASSVNAAATQSHACPDAASVATAPESGDRPAVGQPQSAAVADATAGAPAEKRAQPAAPSTVQPQNTQANSAAGATPPTVAVPAVAPQNAASGNPVAAAPAPAQEQNAAIVNSPAVSNEPDGTAPTPPAPAAAPALQNLHSAQAPATAGEIQPAGSNAQVPASMKAVWRENPRQPEHTGLQHTALTSVSVAESAQVETDASTSRPRFTLHLLSSRRKADLIRLVKTHGLDQAGYYVVRQAGGANYRLIYGGFQTVSAAREVLKVLPPALYVHRPWVNNYPTDVVVRGF